MVRGAPRGPINVVMAMFAPGFFWDLRNYICGQVLKSQEHFKEGDSLHRGVMAPTHEHIAEIRSLYLNYPTTDVSSTEAGTDSALDLTTTDSEARIQTERMVFKNVDWSQSVDTLLDIFTVKSDESMSDVSGFQVDVEPKSTSSPKAPVVAPKVPVLGEKLILRPFVKVYRLKDCDIPQRQPTILELKKYAKKAEKGEDIDSSFEEDPTVTALRQEEMEEKFKAFKEENPSEPKVNKTWGMRRKAEAFRKYSRTIGRRETWKQKVNLIKKAIIFKAKKEWAARYRSETKTTPASPGRAAETTDDEVPEVLKGESKEPEISEKKLTPDELQSEEKREEGNAAQTPEKAEITPSPEALQSKGKGEKAKTLKRAKQENSPAPKSFKTKAALKEKPKNLDDPAVIPQSPAVMKPVVKAKPKNVAKKSMGGRPAVISRSLKGKNPNPKAYPPLRVKLTSRPRKGTTAFKKSCPICKKNVDLHKLCDHVEEEHNVFLCLQCDGIFGSSKSYKEHIKKHDADNFKCKDCGKTFAYQSDLHHHSLTHATDKQFSCTECDRSFKRKSDLTFHIKTKHTQEDVPPKENCKFCDKVFDHKKKLHQHLKIHQEPSYVCKECDEKFMWLAQLNRHMQSKH